MGLITKILRSTAQEFSTHAEEDVFGLGAESVVAREIAHGSAGLADNVKYNVLGGVIGSWLLARGASGKVDPLEHLADRVVLQLTLLVNLKVPSDFPKVRLDI